MKPSIRELVGAVITAVATPCVIIGAAVLLFLNPIWVGFEQDRSGAAQWTGYTSAQVNQVTGSILSDLVFGPPDFDAAVDGKIVLDARERGHMADVRTVMGLLGGLAGIAAILLFAIGLASRGRRWFWRAAATGASALVIGVVVVGVGLAIFFDQVFELFHEVFFGAGTYSFDPRTEKLVQLFPDQFWSETSIALAVVVLGLALATVFVARRLEGRGDDASTAESVP